MQQGLMDMINMLKLRCTLDIHVKMSSRQLNIHSGVQGRGLDEIDLFMSHQYTDEIQNHDQGENSKGLSKDRKDNSRSGTLEHTNI
jgi:hypothetical protein